ncbi:MAG: MASE1 domain-containing protein [Actinomycetota bacterium]
MPKRSFARWIGDNGVGVNIRGDTKAKSWSGPRYVLTIVAVAALYVLAARLAFSLGAVAGNAAPVWPPSGLALAALLLLGRRYWPAVTLGALVANLTTEVPIGAAIAPAAGNTLEAMLGAYLLRRTGFDLSMSRVRDVLAFTGLAAGISTTVSATFGVTSLLATGVINLSDYGQVWRLWWLADLAGDLLLAPLILIFVKTPLPRLRPAAILELAVLAVSATAVALLVFGRPSGATMLHYSFVLFPFFVWAALRFEGRGATSFSILISAIAIWGAAHDLGPFARLPEAERLLVTQTFMAIVAATSLLLAAAIVERRRAQRELQSSMELLSRADEERRALLGRLTDAQEEERRRIAGDLHDDPIQTMTAVLLRLHALKAAFDGHDRADKLTKLEEDIEESISHLRRLMVELRPPVLDRAGLGAVLEQSLESLRGETGTKTTLDDRLETQPSGEVKIIAFRIAQEALTNVRKHARAARVWVGISEAQGGLRVKIADDGAGFDTDEVPESPSGHLGLSAMRERAEMVGGWCTVTSTPGEGTSIEFWLPAESAVTTG